MITTSKRQNWRTPPAVFQALHERHRFTVDAFASLANHLVPRYWHALDSAFDHDWAGEVVFANPPFGRIRECLEYALEQQARDWCGGVFLLPANIGTTWYHDLARHFTIGGFRGRVDYALPPDAPREKRSGASFDSLTLTFGDLRDPTRNYLPTPFVTQYVLDAKTGRLIEGELPEIAPF